MSDWGSLAAMIERRGLPRSIHMGSKAAASFEAAIVHRTVFAMFLEGIPIIVSTGLDPWSIVVCFEKSMVVTTATAEPSPLGGDELGLEFTKPRR